jgi:hypothetical protein
MEKTDCSMTISSKKAKKEGKKTSFSALKAVFK